MRAMRCAAVLKQLNRYHDAELEPMARAEVEAHLADCAACRAALATLEGVEGVWAAIKTPPVPGGFAERVMRQARKRTKSHAQPQRAWASWPLLGWWREESPAMRAAAAAVVVAGLLVGTLLGVSSSSAQVSKPARSENAIAENMALLTGAPRGSLEQSYVALAFPASSTPDSP